MTAGVLVFAGVVCAVIFALVLIFRRDLVGVDLTARSLVRMYLYLASLAAVMVLVIGLAAALDWAMASTVGGEAVYGRPPIEMVCPPGEKCPDPAQLRQQYLHEREQRHDQDLIRGITFAFFGLVFWGGHRIARRRAAGPDERTSALRRAYLTLGTFVFGMATIVLIPVGAYLAVSAWVIDPRPDVDVQGVGESLSGGVVALPLWLSYLLRLVRDFRAAP